ncbi:unnamed protein product [Alternaria alternata]
MASILDQSGHEGEGNSIVYMNLTLPMLAANLDMEVLSQWACSEMDAEEVDPDAQPEIDASDFVDSVLLEILVRIPAVYLHLSLRP